MILQHTGLNATGGQHAHGSGALTLTACKLHVILLNGVAVGPLDPARVMVPATWDSGGRANHTIRYETAVKQYLSLCGTAAVPDRLNGIDNRDRCTLQHIQRAVASGHLEDAVYMVRYSFLYKILFCHASDAVPLTLQFKRHGTQHCRITRRTVG
jgi:hypothetical protein